jgi:uncharacterized membrane protein (DUF485 family)
MKIRSGVTQDYYRKLSPDQKLQWKLVTWCISLLASWLVTKTGYRVFDFLVATSCTLCTMLMIESQRSYSEYSRKTRRLAVITAILIARWGIGGLGIIYFALVTVGAMGQTLHDSRSLTRLPAAAQAAFAVMFVGAAIYQSIKMFRRLGFEELVVTLPAAKLKELLVKRRFIAQDFRSFLAFELGVTFFSYCYASIVAGLANVLIRMSNT